MSRSDAFVGTVGSSGSGVAAPALELPAFSVNVQIEREAFFIHANPLRPARVVVLVIVVVVAGVVVHVVVRCRFR